MIFDDKKKAVYLLAHTKGIGSIKGRRVISALSDITMLFSKIVILRDALTRIIGEKEYVELCENVRTFDFDKLEEEYASQETKIITVVDEEYPKSLMCYEDMPLILYCKGDISLLNKPCFAVVGTRYPTKYGVRATEEFVSQLSSRFCIVSGFARGVDSKAHRVCLDVKGKTIAVMGCGVDVVYPAENYALYKDILSYGLVISEYDNKTKATACNFPSRNRIISGLSSGVLITEAGEKSGTMITKDYALSQGKDVYCVPGSIYSNASGGCNRSIRECQSRAVMDINDIYDEMGIGKVDTKKPNNIQLDFNEEMILNKLNQNGEMHFEEILDEVDLTVPQLNSLLIKMEAVGLINKTKTNYWSV